MWLLLGWNKKKQSHTGSCRKIFYISKVHLQGWMLKEKNNNERTENSKIKKS